ncbi:MAG: hypothetical protein LN413_00445 [Candidatus Thermoplasmatota archaeon]|nr:hypothetical protein [Candidatus Thermoplasmatota archaeon]
MRRAVLRGIGFGIAITLAVALVTAVLLSNIRTMTGPVDAGEVVIGPLGSECADYCIAGPGILNLRNNTAKPFAFNVTSQVDRTIDFHLHLQFWMSGILAGGFTVLSFSWSIERAGLGPVALDPTPQVNTTTHWTEDFNDTLGPFGSHRYTVTVLFAFIGGGDYSFEVYAADDRWVP